MADTHGFEVQQWLKLLLSDLVVICVFTAVPCAIYIFRVPLWWHPASAKEERLIQVESRSQAHHLLCHRACANESVQAVGRTETLACDLSHNAVFLLMLPLAYDACRCSEEGAAAVKKGRSPGIVSKPRLCMVCRSGVDVPIRRILGAGAGAGDCAEGVQRVHVPVPGLSDPILFLE